MRIDRTLAAVVIITSVGWSDAALDYVNHFRQQAGLPAFTSQSNLYQAAQAHSHYMKLNNVAGHTEESSKDGYTGDHPWDRVIATGYYSTAMSENVAAGKSTVEHAIDSLFSAIYHRFGFLNPANDEIGIGAEGIFYTFDMGNTKKNDLCQNGTYSSGSYVYNVCKDADKKIALDDWNAAEDDLKAQSGELVLWPPPAGSDVLPAFYSESPDPLPDDAVSGYPVSVQFNDHYYSTAPTISSFTVAEAKSGSELPIITQMDKDNDPNDEFSAYQYALFPQNRLEWGTTYTVSLSYDDGSGQQDLSWCFATRSLASQAERFYRIENNSDLSVSVISRKTYAVYVVPADSNDVLGGCSSVGYTSGNEPDISYVDGNTFLITLQGENNDYAELTFNNGQKIKFVIDNNDTAEPPAAKTCPDTGNTDSDGDGLIDLIDVDDDNDGVVDTKDAFPLDPSESVDTDHDGIGNNADTDDDNDGILDTVEMQYGLNPFNSSDAHADADGDGFDNAMEISVGTDIHDAASHPKWTLVVTGDDLMIPVPVK